LDLFISTNRARVGDDGVFSFGDAQNQGSLPGLGVRVNNVVGAVPT